MKRPPHEGCRTDPHGEDSFEAILDSITDGISVITRDMKISYANSITKRQASFAVMPTQDQTTRRT